MQDVKKIVLVIVLLAAIVTAVWFTVKRVGGHAEPPAWYDNTVDEKIDWKTLKIIALPRKEWSRLTAGPFDWKNPETGEVTVRDIMICASCGEKIPYPELPTGGKGGRGAFAATMAQYMCPKCGKVAWAGGGGHGPVRGRGATQ